MTTRHITDQQFVNGTAIDANRVQKALTDIEEYTNSIPLESIDKRFSLNYLILTAVGAKTVPLGGPAPTTTMGPRYSPFLQDSTADGLRVKGTQRKYGPTTASGTLLSSAFVWTVSALFPRPVVIDTVSVYINGAPFDPDGTMHLVDDGVAVPGDAGISAHRVRLIIDTDDVIAAEDRTLNSKEYTLQNFEESNYLDSSEAKALSTDMLPTGSTLLHNPANPTYENLWLVRENINRPLHQFSRTRFRLVFYGADGVDLFTTSPRDVTFTIVYKEALVEG